MASKAPRASRSPEVRKQKADSSRSSSGSFEPLLFCGSHAGLSGKNNEDAVETQKIQDPHGHTRYVAVVADGIGGHASGEVASHMAVRHVIEALRRASGRSLLPAMVEAVKEANRAVFASSQSKELWKGMGTTLTIAVVEDGKLYLAHIGDSRAYLIRQDRIVQLTVDHTWAQEAIEAGRLTPEEARIHPNRNVLKRYVGIMPDVEVDTRVMPLDGEGKPDPGHQPIPLQPGDVVLLCTDGLHDVVSDDQILEIVRSNPGDQAVQALIRAANAAGGPDNISVALIEMPGREIKAPLIRLRLSSIPWPVGVGLLAVAAAVLIGALLMWTGVWGGSSSSGSRKSIFGPSNVATPIVLLGNETGATPVGIAEMSATATPRPTRTPTATATRPPPTRTPTPTMTPVPTDTPPPPPPPPSGGDGGGSNPPAEPPKEPLPQP